MLLEIGAHRYLNNTEEHKDNILPGDTHWSSLLLQHFRLLGVIDQLVVQSMTQVTVHSALVLALLKYLISKWVHHFSLHWNKEGPDIAWLVVGASKTKKQVRRKQEKEGERGRIHGKKIGGKKKLGINKRGTKKESEWGKEEISVAKNIPEKKRNNGRTEWGI